MTHSGVVRRPLYCSGEGGVLPSKTALWWYKQQLALTVAVIHGLVCGILKIYFDFFWKLRVILWCSITGWCDTKFCDDSSQLSPPQTFKIQILVAIHYKERTWQSRSQYPWWTGIFPLAWKMRMLSYYWKVEFWEMILLMQIVTCFINFINHCFHADWLKHNIRAMNWSHVLQLKPTRLRPISNVSCKGASTVFYGLHRCVIIEF